MFCIKVSKVSPRAFTYIDGGLSGPGKDGIIRYVTKSGPNGEVLCFKKENQSKGVLQRLADAFDVDIDEVSVVECPKGMKQHVVDSIMPDQEGDPDDSGERERDIRGESMEYDFDLDDDGEVEEYDEAWADTYDIMFSQSLEEQDENLTDEQISESEIVEGILQRLHKMTAGAKAKARRAYKRGKVRILRRLKKYRNSARGKRHAAILHKILKRLGKHRPRTRINLNQSTDYGDSNPQFESLFDALEYAKGVVESEADEKYGEDDELDEEFDRRSYMRDYMRKYRQGDKWKAYQKSYREKLAVPRQIAKNFKVQQAIDTGRSSAKTKDARKVAKADVQAAFSGFGQAGDSDREKQANAFGKGQRRAMRSAAKDQTDARKAERKANRDAFGKKGKRGELAVKGFGTAGDKERAAAARAWAAGQKAAAESYDFDDFENDLGEGIVATHKTTSAERRDAKAWRRSAAGKKSIRKQVRRQHSAAGQRRSLKLAKAHARMGDRDLGPRKRLQVNSTDENANLSEMLDQALGLFTSKE